MEVVAALSQGRTAAAQCGLFTHKSVPVIFETPCTLPVLFIRYLCVSTTEKDLKPKQERSLARLLCMK